MDAEVGSAAHDLVGAVDQARGRRARRRREPPRVRHRARRRQAGRRRHGRDATDRHKGDDRRAGPRDDAARRIAARDARPARASAATTSRSCREDGYFGRLRQLVPQAARSTARLVRRSTIASSTSRARRSRSRAGCASIDYGKEGDVDGHRGRASRNVSYTRQRSPSATRSRRARRRSTRSAASTRSSRCRRRRTSATRNVAARRDRPHAQLLHALDSRSRSSAGPSSRCRRRPSAGPFLVGGGGDVTVAAKYFAGGVLPGAPGQLVRQRDPDVVHAAEPRRLRVRQLAAVVGLSRLVTTTTATAARQAAAVVESRRQDRCDGRARAAHGLLVGEAVDADDRSSANASVQRRQPPDSGRRRRRSSSIRRRSTSASRRSGRSSRRARRSTST